VCLSTSQCLCLCRNHMIYRTSTNRSDSVDVRYSACTSLCSPNEDFGRPNKHFRMRFRSTFQCFVAQIKSQHASSHIDRFRFASRCAISDFVFLGHKITTCIIAHRSIRFASRCAISVLYLLARIESVNVRFIGLVIFWPRNTTPDIAHRPTRPQNPRFKDAHTGTNRRFDA
jgi:hypothetical protein